MKVLYFASGLMLGVGVVAQINDHSSAWGIILVPAMLALAIAVALETNGLGK